jgi:hypothetical protein
MWAHRRRNNIHQEGGLTRRTLAPQPARPWPGRSPRSPFTKALTSLGHAPLFPHPSFDKSRRCSRPAAPANNLCTPAPNTDWFSTTITRGTPVNLSSLGSSGVAPGTPATLIHADPQRAPPATLNHKQRHTHLRSQPVDMHNTDVRRCVRYPRHLNCNRMEKAACHPFGVTLWINRG